MIKPFLRVLNSIFSFFTRKYPKINKNKISLDEVFDLEIILKYFSLF